MTPAAERHNLHTAVEARDRGLVLAALAAYGADYARSWQMRPRYHTISGELYGQFNKRDKERLVAYLEGMLDAVDGRSYRGLIWGDVMQAVVLMRDLDTVKPRKRTPVWLAKFCANLPFWPGGNPAELPPTRNPRA